MPRLSDLSSSSALARLSLPVIPVRREEHLGCNVRGCSEVLNFAWESFDRAIEPQAIREQLTAIAARHPGFASTIADRFDALERFYRAAQSDGSNAWVKVALRGHAADGVLLDLKPTCILMRVPGDLFTKLKPGADGYTVSYDALPEELRGRIVLLPAPARSNQDKTFRHEVVHTLQDQTSRSPAMFQYGTTISVKDASSPREALEAISLLGVFPRYQALREIIAYEGSGDHAVRLGPLGLDEARLELESVRKGLSLNTRLSPAEKREVFSVAREMLSDLFRYLVDVRRVFQQRIALVGFEQATAESIVCGVERVPWFDRDLVDHLSPKSLIVSLEQRMLARIDLARTSGNLEWWSDDWTPIREQLQACPDAKLLPLLCEGIQKSTNSFLVNDMLEAVVDALFLDPHALSDRVIDGLMKRLSDLRTQDGCDNRWLSGTIDLFIGMVNTGCLIGSPFVPHDRTPEGEVCTAILSDAPRTSIGLLFTDRYPNRDPFWNPLTPGAFDKAIDQMPVAEQLDVYLLMAQHSSNGVDVWNAVCKLASYVREGNLPVEFRQRTRFVLDQLPPDDTGSLAIAWSAESLTIYQENLSVIEQFCRE